MVLTFLLFYFKDHCSEYRHLSLQETKLTKQQKDRIDVKYFIFILC